MNVTGLDLFPKLKSSFCQLADPSFLGEGKHIQ